MSISPSWKQDCMKLLIKGVSLGLIFLAPLGLVIARYAGSEERTVIESSFGVLPTLFVIAIGAVGFSFISQQFMEMVRTNKFGFLSISFFGGSLAFLLFAGLFILQSIKNASQANFDAFTANLAYHIQTLTYSTAFVVAGVAVATIYWLTTLNFKKKRPY
jgi:hypothetical protein